MTLRPQRRSKRAPARRRPCVADATIAPDPGPPPEAVFDRVTGPYAPHGQRAALACPGACELDEGS
jgi:hypothetical protein